MKYNLYQRTVNGKKRWYYWYYGERGQQVRKSCGVRASSRYEAEQVIRNIEARGETVASYARGFFDHDSDREDSIKWLFVKGGLPIRTNYLLLTFKRIIAKHLDVEGLTLDIHSLRYTYNTISRLPHDLLWEWIGHKSESMTPHYYSPSLEDKKKEISHHKDVVDSFFTS